MTPAQKEACQAVLRQDVQPLLDRERAFFRAIGVRQDITTYGQQLRFDSIVTDGWTFTQAGFRRFGAEAADHPCRHCGFTGRLNALLRSL